MTRAPARPTWRVFCSRRLTTPDVPRRYGSAHDGVRTLPGLRLAETLREHVLRGMERRTATIVLDVHMYAVAAVVWSVLFEVLPVLDTKRTTTLWQEFRGLCKAAFVGVRAMARL